MQSVKNKHLRETRGNGPGIHWLFLMLHSSSLHPDPAGLLPHNLPTRVSRSTINSDKLIVDDPPCT